LESDSDHPRDKAYQDRTQLKRGVIRPCEESREHHKIGQKDDGAAENAKEHRVWVGDRVSLEAYAAADDAQDQSNVNEVNCPQDEKFLSGGSNCHNSVLPFITPHVHLEAWRVFIQIEAQDIA